jgi:ribosomal protein L11 methyltransferase
MREEATEAVGGLARERADSGYRRLRLRFPEAGEDEVVGQLWLAGTAGIEEVARGEGEVEVLASFAVGDLAGRVDAAEAALPAVRPAPQGPLVEDLAASGARVLALEVLRDDDWLARYRESVQPIPVGRGLLVDPREPDAAAPVTTERVLLRLPVRSAFGVGSHESTRLAVALLEDLAAEDAVRGRRVLDVGTGTGILAFYALALGARTAVGFDLDLEAAVLAHQNRALNQLAPALFAGTTAALSPTARYDLVLVNVLPEEVAAELDRLVGLVDDGGELVFSGVLAVRGPGLLDELARRGLDRLVASRDDGEWVAFRLARTKPPRSGRT